MKRKNLFILFALLFLAALLLMAPSLRMRSIFGNNVWVVFPGQSIQTKFNSAKAVSNETDRQTVLILPGHYEQKLEIDADGTNDCKYITVTGLGWAADSTVLYVDSDTDSDADGTIDDGPIIIGFETTAGLVDEIRIANLTLENRQNAAPDPAIIISTGDSSRKAIGTVYYDYLIVRGHHDGWQHTLGPSNASDMSTHYISNCWIYASHDPWALKGSCNLYSRNNYFICDYNIFLADNPDTDWKFTGLHFNAGKGGVIHNTARFHSKDDWVKITASCDEQAVSGGTHEYTAGIFLYGPGTHQQDMTFENLTIDVDFETDSTTNDCSDIPVAGVAIQDGNIVTGLRFINSKFRIYANDDSASAPDNVYGIYFEGDGTSDTSMDGILDAIIIDTYNATSGGSDYAIGLGTNTNASLKIWGHLDTDDNIDDTANVTFDDGHLP